MRVTDLTQITKEKLRRAVSEEREMEINLRSSCLDCQFLSNCPIVEKKSSPESDVLIGSYRFRALNDKCLL